MKEEKRDLSVRKIKKRDGRIVDFNQDKIFTAILKAMRAVGELNKEKAETMAQQVTQILNKRFDGHTVPSVEEIQDIVEEVLIKNRLVAVAKAYILYRDLHNKIRSINSLVDSDELVMNYIQKLDWRVRENSNMTYSLQGLNNHVAGLVSSNYWLNQIYSPEVREAHLSGDLHLHDLAILAAYCCGWDLQDFLRKGFGGVLGKISCKPPKHLRTALAQLVNLIYTLQGETAGAQAVSNFDTLLAPFIYYDKLDYKGVKQCLQEFMFGMNVPTRVGFQCFSEDTEILTSEGWRGHDEIEEGMIIKTFNIKTKTVEEKKVTSVFKKEYRGVMYNLKNRIQDQLISPRHRVVRRKFNTNDYVLEPIEEILKLKSPFVIPVSAENSAPDAQLSDEQIKLMAWIIGEGSLERPGKHRCCYRVSIYQSAIKNHEKYEEIKKLLKHFGLNFSEYTQHGWGEPVQRLRLDAFSSRKIHEWFSKESIKFVPSYLLCLSQRQSKLFLETYIKAEGFEKVKIAVSDPEILDDLQAIATNAGYGSTVLVRPPTVGTKLIFVLRLITHKETYIEEVNEIQYEGIIWCPHTENETVVARRNGKVFITGNTPFSNITLDFVVPKMLAKEPVIVGGEPQKKTYGDFQKEVNILNKALGEVLLEGDAQGRVFSFPIPTINITKDFDWENPYLDNLWEATRKYGIPYFSNFVNSDMKPEDVRSMCCRLRLSNTELRKKGGGLFGANPLTGAVGVVTINLPRIGYLNKTKEEFFDRLEYLMDLAKESLIIKRRMVEEFTEKGLYPYSRYYLEDIKQRFGQYWKNHFSTIGLVGMNEACLNFMGKNIAEKEGKAFAVEVLDFMRRRLVDYQKQENQLFNLEATPAEGTSYRFAREDKKRYKDIIFANDKAVKEKKAEPYYTNSTQLPVSYTDDIFEALKHQDELQCKYTGGCVEGGNKVLTNKGLLNIEYIVENFEKLKPIEALSYNLMKGVSEWDEIVDAITIDVEKKNKIKIRGERALDIVTSDWHPFFVLEKVKASTVCPVCQKKVRNIKSFVAHLRYNPDCRRQYNILPKYKVVEKRADVLRVGDYILQNSDNLYLDKQTKLNNDLMWLIGFFIGDGCLSSFTDNRGGNSLRRYKIRFFSESKGALERVERILSKSFQTKAKVIQNDKRSKVLRELATCKKEVSEFFFKYGFKEGRKVYDVSISQEVKENLNKKNIFSLLAGLMDSDGFVNKRDGDFEYYTVSSRLADDILEICTRAGIMISKVKKSNKRKNEISGWRLRIPSYQVTKIKDELTKAVKSFRIKKHLSDRKRRRLPVVRVKEISKVDVIENKFYDLTTKKNHNYLAGKSSLIFIHNTVLHGFLGESLPDVKSLKNLVKKIAEQFHLPYYTITPTFSICPVHGYLAGEHYYCPKCDLEIEKQDL